MLFWNSHMLRVYVLAVITGIPLPGAPGSTSCGNGCTNCGILFAFSGICTTWADRTGTIKKTEAASRAGKTARFGFITPSGIPSVAWPSRSAS